MEYFAYIVLSLMILLVMVLIHELGHYTAAKILGFTVEEFAVGFGPKVFSKRRKNGEIFSLRVLPLGGFCAFLGEDAESEDTADEHVDAVDNFSDVKADGSGDTVVAPTQQSARDDDLLSYVMRAQIDENKRVDNSVSVKAEDKPIRLDKDGNPAKTFYKQKPWKRIIVLLGGVLFNFLSAIVFSFIYIWSVGYAAPQVTRVYSDPAGELYCPNLIAGDIILAVAGENIGVMKSFSDLSSAVADGQTVTFKVSRDGEVISVDVKRQSITAETEEGSISTYSGFGFTSQQVFIGGTAGNAFKYCVPYTFKLSWSILGSFGQLITGKVPITSVSGPIGSINLMAKLSIANWRNILILLPLLASNLAIFNLLPFPALDGAQIVFTIIEWIRKKPINRKVQGIVNFVGLAVLLLFVLIVDILSFVL